MIKGGDIDEMSLFVEHVMQLHFLGKLVGFWAPLFLSCLLQVAS